MQDLSLLQCRNAILNSRWVEVSLEGLDEDPVRQAWCLGHEGVPLVAVGRDADAAGRATLVFGESEVRVICGCRLQRVSPGADSARRLARHGQALGADAHQVYLAHPESCELVVADAAPVALDYATLGLACTFDAEREAFMVGHMNDDHIREMLDYCRQAGLQTENAQVSMAGIDHYGFDLLLNGDRVRFDFGKPYTQPRDAAMRLVEMAMAAREEGAAPSP